MEEKRYKKGDHIIDEGQDGDELFVVENGNLSCFK
jgi:CRP-like cAMP-binding protein